MPDAQPGTSPEGRTISKLNGGSPSKSTRSPSRSTKQESRSAQPGAVSKEAQSAMGTQTTSREASRGPQEKKAREAKPGTTTTTTTKKTGEGSRAAPAPTGTTAQPTTTTHTSSSEEEEGTEEGTEESLAIKDADPQLESSHDAHDEADDGPLVDMETFGQLLEMDDDEEHSFSKSLTWDYFDQAVTTFKEMDAAVLGGDLITLSRKGHFLKGSSAALGLNRVKASCEKMQHYGNKKKANGEGTLSESEAMDQCKSLLKQLKEEQKLSKAWLERFYAERNV